MSCRAAQAAARLRAEGYDMAWYLVGPGEPVAVRYDVYPDGTCKARVYRLTLPPGDPMATDLVAIGYRRATMGALP